MVSVFLGSCCRDDLGVGGIKGLGYKWGVDLRVHLDPTYNAVP